MGTIYNSKVNTYPITEIAKTCNGSLQINAPENVVIDDLLIDSRKLISTHRSLFIALKTKSNDGHLYIEELVEKGVLNFIVEVLPGNWDQLKANFVLVKSSLAAMQSIAAAHRKKFNIPIIGITGSNGKTIVKEWIYQVLQSDHKICRSPKSYNSQLGVPLSVFQLQAEDQLGVFEAGISQPDEMLRLGQVIKPNIGIFTNIGDAHHQHFVDMRQKVNEKLNLFVKSKVLIFCRDHTDITDRIYNLELFKNKTLLDWSRKNKSASLFIQEITVAEGFTIINANRNGQTLTIKIPFVDEASLENAMHVWILLLHLGLSQDDIYQRMLKLSPIAMRMELKEGINQCSVINDSYNSDFNGFIIALDFLFQQQQHQRKTVILSDILQSGKEPQQLYREVANALRLRKIHRFIGIGPTLKLNKHLFEGECHFYDSTSDFLLYFPFSTFRDETILLKGARDFEFEKINRMLSRKMHQTRLEVDLNNMLHNYKYFKSKLKPETKIMIMVKAFSYGSGSFEVANLLQFHHADYLAVAYADEGIELRRTGIRLPIMVMNPELDALESIINHQLEPEIYSFTILNQLIQKIDDQLVPANKPIGIHLKIETGMHRLGFDAHEIEELIKILKHQDRIIIKSIFSHLVASDDVRFDDFTRQQIATFHQLANQIMNSFNYPIMKHIANSAAIVLHPEAQMDMVRLGIGLYGIAANEDRQTELQVVSSLYTIISQIKHIQSGESVGYNRTFVADRPMRIATLPIGYADGYNRRFGNGVGKVKIANQLLPVIGNVCMDMCMVDLGEVEAQEGDEVCIFGQNPDLTALAQSIGTIPYELLTSVSSRVKRIYIQE